MISLKYLRFVNWLCFNFTVMTYGSEHSLKLNKSGFKALLQVCNILKLHWSFRIIFFFSHLTENKKSHLKTGLEGKKKVWGIWNYQQLWVTQNLLHNDLGYQTFSGDKWFQIREVSSIVFVLRYLPYPVNYYL